MENSIKSVTNVDNKDLRLDGNYLPQCESVRGIAIILVFFFHYLGNFGGYGAYPEKQAGMGLLYGGNTGVTLFFILSSFLLTRPFFKGTPMQYRIFFSRRALRIIPMFYFAILIGALINNQWFTALKSLFFYDIGIATLWPMGGVWWSLVLEVQFYILIPLIIFISNQKKLRFLLIPIGVAAIYGYLRVRSAEPADLIALRGNLIGRWPVFFTGAALAWLQVNYMEKKAYDITEKSWVGFIICSISIAMLILLCDHRVKFYGINAHLEWFDHYLLEGLAWTLFMFSVLNFRFPGYKILINPVLHKFGTWSYSIYLLHAAIIFYALKRFHIFTPDSAFGIALSGITLLVISALISSLTYKYIEKPFLRIKPKLTKPT